MIIQSRIKKVVFYHDKYQVFAEIARNNLKTAKICYTRYSIIAGVVFMLVLYIVHAYMIVHVQ